ncbi:hypothetical protein CKQ70_30565 [Bacillus toyonensis]|nr:hypothetical protein CKQ70_30565 [Bacillus toyonensis]PAW43706.1 hypothetical protein CKQ69_30875 [Bacillus toyonensis]
MATNLEIVELEAMMIGYEFDGNNLKSFAEWKKEGYSVIKGQKATIKCGLWKPFKKKLVDEKTGEKIMDEKTGKQKEETRFKLVDTALFTREQVQKLDSKIKDQVDEVAPVEEKESLIIEEAVTPFVKIEAVVQPDTIEVVEEKPAIEIKRAHFESKPSNVEEVKKREISSYDRYAVAETIELSIVDFYSLCDSLLSDRDYLKGKGGTYTTTEPEGCDDVENFFDLTPAQQKEWRRGAYRNCVKVTCSSATFDLLIDPQGYNYGRYVAIEYK